ncbi:AEC family transporter [Tahibacter amnicola]|uniref:AEC family transporter n=1 Tax=Tahibacter amnicola TaxID=2976241 RepID=A0ABY6BGA3_9GAMM|nr:AEC family transporter [Tahibacter amnicola]UXI68323.1 AEC family transporter [Tahibacter amnicola]
MVASFAFILILLGLGKYLALRRLVPESAPDALNMVVLYVCLPASVLLNASKLTWSLDVLGVAAVPWVLLGVSTVMVVALARLTRMRRDATALLLLEVPLGNTSFLGFALVPVLAGAEALRYAVVFDQLGSFLILSIVGLSVIAYFAGGERPGLRAIVRRVAGFPRCWPWLLPWWPCRTNRPRRSA